MKPLSKEQLEFLKLLSKNKSKAEIIESMKVFAETECDFDMIYNACCELFNTKTKDELIKKYYEYLLEMEF